MQVHPQLNKLLARPARWLTQVLRPLARVAPHRDQDTVAAWPPTAARVLCGKGRLAHAAIVAAVPEGLVFAQVPLPQLVRVPNRRSYNEWLARTGHLVADLVLCDRSSQVLTVVQLIPSEDSPRRRQRRERMRRVLAAAGVPLLEWPQGWQPERQALRAALLDRN